jgi:hypothetical protein
MTAIRESITVPKVIRLRPLRRPEKEAERPKPVTTTFTGRGKDLLRAVRFDRTVDAYAKVVMAVIVDHLNERTQTAFLSDDTIAFETGSGWPRKVSRARRNLRDANWLMWKHTRTVNVYSVNWTKAAEILAILKRESTARNKKFSNSDSDVSRRPDSDAGVRQTP